MHNFMSVLAILGQLYQCVCVLVCMRTAIINAGLQIYGGPGTLPHDFKIWPITFQGSEPSGPILLVVKKSHFNKKKIHPTASLQTPQNR